MICESEDEWDEEELEEWQRREDEHALSPAGIAEQNASLLRRYDEFRRVADAVTDRWKEHEEIAAIALIGSVAQAPWKEVPRFQPLRRSRIAVWHECGDIDLALWLTHTRNLNALRRAKGKALRDLKDASGIGVADHQVEGFILEPETNIYLGRLCVFNQCPKGKPECRVPGCGTHAFLRLHEAFQFRSKSLAPGKAVRLFERRTGILNRAADLPLPSNTAT